MLAPEIIDRIRREREERFERDRPALQLPLEVERLPAPHSDEPPRTEEPSRAIVIDLA